MMNVGYVFVNQGEREALELAKLGDQVLVEYSMPAGTSALLILSKQEWAHGRSDDFSPLGRSVSYTRLPKKWIAAMYDCGTTSWIGQPQAWHRSRWPVPFPARPA